MASNSFGNILRISTWGESHGKAMGVVIDGCPAGLAISEEEIQEALLVRAPGMRPRTSRRLEPDRAHILSGLFEGKTTGAPVCIHIPSVDMDSDKYESMKDLLRPGHANYTYLQKYGIFDYRGAGRASGRETACRVAAGVVAKKILQIYGIQAVSYIKQIGHIVAVASMEDLPGLLRSIENSPLFCPDPSATVEMEALIDAIASEGDSIGGMVEFRTGLLPTGLGEPVYEKISSCLAYALMSIPGAKGIEIGSGFASVAMKGSEHNDLFFMDQNRVCTQTNHAGGLLGGITNGMPLVGRVAFKPPSSIAKPMDTLTTKGDRAVFELPVGSRHDPCIAIRSVPVVESIVALVLADALLMDRTSRI